MINVMTITGIRPDFIRMSALFKRLDDDPEISHILIHTGQHYDEMLSDVFFDELQIRKPDYNLGISGPGMGHVMQSSFLIREIFRLLKSFSEDPDIILFLGDSNSVLASVPLKKEGYKIGHIEAGMRSRDKRMLEEINRIVCDHCSDLHFVYHEDYKQNLLEENLPIEDIHVVGNTIVEVCLPLADELFKTKKANDQILLDIHRPENFKYKNRLQNIISYAHNCIDKYRIPVKMLKFGRTMKYIQEFGIDLGDIQLIDMMSYKQFLEAQYHSLFIISDSGTAQEEASLLGTLVIVPRDYTERPQSLRHNCSAMIDVNHDSSKEESFQYIDNVVHGETIIDSNWLGDGTTSKQIIEIIRRKL